MIVPKIDKHTTKSSVRRYYKKMLNRHIRRTLNYYVKKGDWNSLFKKEKRKYFGYD